MIVSQAFIEHLLYTEPLTVNFISNPFSSSLREGAKTIQTLYELTLGLREVRVTCPKSHSSPLEPGFESRTSDSEVLSQSNDCMLSHFSCV